MIKDSIQHPPVVMWKIVGKWLCRFCSEQWEKALCSSHQQLNDPAYPVELCFHARRASTVHKNNSAINLLSISFISFSLCGFYNYILFIEEIIENRQDIKNNKTTSNTSTAISLSFVVLTSNMRRLRVADTETTDGGRKRELIPIARIRSTAPGNQEDPVEIEAITPRVPKSHKFKRDRRVRGAFSSAKAEVKKKVEPQHQSQHQYPHDDFENEPKINTTRGKVEEPLKMNTVTCQQLELSHEQKSAYHKNTDERPYTMNKQPSHLQLPNGQKIPFRREQSSVSKISKKQFSESGNRTPSREQIAAVIQGKKSKQATTPNSHRNASITRKAIPTPKRQEEGQELALGFTDLSEEELRDFDLMNISITIYGMTGILCEEEESKKAKKRTPLKSKHKGQSEEDPHNEGIPTTVAASMQRNVTSSKTVIETFLPSQPMNIYSEPGKRTRLSSHWQSPSYTLLQGQDAEDENNVSNMNSSFQMLRMMMKKPFSKGQQQGIVENYEHETIKIGLNLCRGKELLRLGTATLVVTGEEEGEVMIHIPVSPISELQKVKVKGGQPGKKSKQKKERKEIKTCFENDNRHFTLAENSSLHVGVRVHPQQDIEAAAQYQDEVTTTDSELLRRAHAAKTTMMKERATALGYQARALYKHHPAAVVPASFRSKQRNSIQKQSSPPQAQLSNNPNPTETRQQTQQQLQFMVPQRPATTVAPGMQSMLTSFLCGAALPMMSDTEPSEEANPSSEERLHDASATKSLTSGKSTGKSTASKKSDESKDISRNSSSSFPISEVLNMKYGPEYAKSFFSGVTFSTGASSSSIDEDMDLSEVIENTAKQLAMM